MTNPAPTPDLAPTAMPSADGKACITCGYALDGLPLEGLCPECGTAVQLSLKPNRLVFANPQWLASIKRGLVLIEFSIVLRIGQRLFGGFLAAFTGFGMSSRTVVWFGAIVSITTSSLELLGWWLASSPEPAKGTPSSQGTTAIWLRGLAITSVLLYIASILLSHASTFAMTAASEIARPLADCAFAGLLFPATKFFEDLAQRAPLPSLLKTVRLTWALTWVVLIRAVLMLITQLAFTASPAAANTFTGCVFLPLSLAWLVWAVSYLSTIDGTRDMLSRILRHITDHAATVELRVPAGLESNSKADDP